MKTDKIPVPGTVFENNLKERLMNSSSEDLERQRMVREQLECRGIRSRMVLDALAKVPRHLFIPADIRHLAYTDHALLTYCGQTISQPRPPCPCGTSHSCPQALQLNFRSPPAAQGFTR